MKIVSGSNAKTSTEKLRKILKDASTRVGLSAHSANSNLDHLDLDALVTFAGSIITVYHQTLKDAEKTLYSLESALHIAQIEAEAASDLVQSFIDEVEYDEALDHATADMMDEFCASGSADVSPDMELVFSERASFSKEDLKPILRAVIQRWVEQKMMQ